MTDDSICFGDLIETDLSNSWKRNRGRLTNFLVNLGLKGGEISKTLYIFGLRPNDPALVFSELEDGLDHEHWALTAEMNDGSLRVLAFPVSKKVCPTRPEQALANKLLALFIEVHSRLVAWWLVNAWRSKQLAEATWLLGDTLQTIPAAACARSLIETAAAVWLDARKISEIWGHVKRDCALKGPSIKHHHMLMVEINKMLWGSKFDSKAPELAKTHGGIPRTNVLTQIEKLARATDLPVQEDYQWLCNAVHPSIGGMLAFAAPMMGHTSGTHAFQWVCEVPTTFCEAKLSRKKVLVHTASLKRLGIEPNVNSASETMLREATVPSAIARMATLAVEVLEKTLDDALRLVDDVGLTTNAPTMASFPYWRNLIREHGNRRCPCRSGLKAYQCLHRWSDGAPEIASRF